MHRQNRLDKPRLSVSLRLRCRLQVLVGHAEIGVAQVVENRQLMFAQFSQHRSCRVAERVPAHAGDTHSLVKRNFELLGEVGCHVVRIFHREEVSAEIFIHQLPGKF
jgi:hypothetical protein